MKEKMKKVWSEELAEAVIQKYSGNKVFGKNVWKMSLFLINFKPWDLQL